MKKPEISVIVPIYNAEQYLAQTIESIINQSYKNIEANTKSIVEYLNLDETERAITTLPMNYTYGISIINTHLWVGASLILTDKGLMQKEFRQQFKEHVGSNHL